MSPPPQRRRPRRDALRLCLWESGFSQTFLTLSGGAFLAGYALALGAGPLYLGLLVALPFYAQVCQLAGAWLSETVGHRKRLVLLFTGLGRALWLLLIPILWLGPGRPARVLMLVVVVLSTSFILAGSVPWLAWLADLVPRKVRGRWIARRQQILGLVTAVLTLAGGLLVDGLLARSGPILAFGTLFSLAGAAALASQIILVRQPDPEPSAPSGLGPRGGFAEVLAHRGFRKLSRVLFLWNLAIGLSAPFFVLYMLRELAMSFTQVAFYTLLAALTALAANPIWGRLVDRFGVRPVLLLNALLVTAVPLFWFFPRPDFLWPIYIEAVWSGVVWTGFNLAAFSLPLALTPRRGRTWYLALISTLTGAAYATAALAGGGLGRLLEGLSWHAPWGTTLYSYHLIFSLSCLLRLVAALAMRSIDEPGARSASTMVQMVGYSVLTRFSLGRQIFLGPPQPEEKD